MICMIYITHLLPHLTMHTYILERLIRSFGALTQRIFIISSCLRAFKKLFFALGETHTHTLYVYALKGHTNETYFLIFYIFGFGIGPLHCS